MEPVRPIRVYPAPHQDRDHDTPMNDTQPSASDKASDRIFTTAGHGTWRLERRKLFNNRYCMALNQAQS